MASETLTDYERRRLENIRRNDEMMASLKIHLKAKHLSSGIKTKRKEIKRENPKLDKKPKTEFPAAIRRSLRLLQKPPELPSHADGQIRTRECLSMQEAHVAGTSSNDPQFIDTVMTMSHKALLSFSPKKRGKEDGGGCFNRGSLVLREENVACVVPALISDVGFFPSEERAMIVVGDKLGNVGFWDTDCEEEEEEEEGDGIYVYGPHSAPVSGISIQPFLLSKIITSSYDGLIRMMDVNKEMFSMVYSGNDAIFSLSHRPHDIESLYFGEGKGKLKVWNERAGKTSSSYTLHTGRINSIDFNSINNNLMATSSLDGTACIWDLRNINPHHPKSLKRVHHQRAVHSAYFSPSGNCLATTSSDDKVLLLSGNGFEDITVISHNNQSGRLSSFRAIWGWDDQHLFIGNTGRAVDVISTVDRTTLSLESPYMTATPSRFAAHPYRIGVLAAATAGNGRVALDGSSKLQNGKKPAVVYFPEFNLRCSEILDADPRLMDKALLMQLHMEPQILTDYERKRLENIRRNDEMVASLKLHLKANSLSSATKIKRKGIKGYNSKPEKKPKMQSPIVIRRSLRAQGVPPDAATANGVQEDLISSPQKLTNSPSHSNHPIRKECFSIREAHASGTSSNDRKLIDTVVNMADHAPLGFKDKRRGKEDGDCFNLGSLVLKPDNVARLVPSRIFDVGFFPFEERTMIVVGDKHGNVGFWDADCEEGEGDGVYVYGPHSAPVSGILIRPVLISQILTSSYDGLIRMMDVNKEMFSIVYSSNEAIFSLSHRPNDVNSSYFGEGQGGLKVWDERARKASSSYSLHDRRINSIDFNSMNNNLMATSSSDGTACIWDLRNINPSHPKSLKMVNHQKAIHSAYFSPSGNCLATTSFDNKVGLLNGASFDSMTMISHNNQTNRWISSLRAIWGWDDRYLFIGNTKRAVDVISTVDRTTVSLKSPYMTAIPCRFAAHPYKIGVLAGATAGGQVYMWTAQ
ncbi:WD repeat-containing protein 76 [Cinnamomum micranthum f. kanehirae]|uniref:WD repeat-containing protein 76 n=1 Tax=Cinnamomum micranthum f. kanehirae TaxID=337451 RepID=A0A3S3NUM0_9MAGN|nr:WD repeat-containing protein 76 [Cinnamomum micranthum f. kanehirae]